MRDRIIFLLHEEADEAYASAVAQALSPRAVFASPISTAQKLGFGAGAACVALWTPEWAGRTSSASLIELATGHGSCALIACVRGAQAAPEFRAAGLGVVCLGGEPVADALAIGQALDALFDETGSELKRPYRARLGTRAGKAPEKQNWTRQLAVRSAAGLAATVGVVVVASNYVSARATASMPEAEPQTAVATNTPSTIEPAEAAQVLALAPSEESAAPMEGEAGMEASLTLAAAGPLEGAGSFAEAPSADLQSPAGMENIVIADAGLSLRTDASLMLASLEPVAFSQGLEPLAMPVGQEEDVLMSYFAPVTQREDASSEVRFVSGGSKHTSKSAS